MTVETQSELDHESVRSASATFPPTQTVGDLRPGLIEAIDKSFDFLLEQERFVPSVRIEARQLRASAIPAFERNQITGYEFEMGDITFRIIRRSTRLRCRIGGWLIEKVGDPARGLFVDRFPKALQTLWILAVLIGLHCGRSGPVRITFNVWQRRPG
jgi:hypothetical protein